MAKQCLYCGQLLPKDDAHFCNECGRSQASPDAPAPIKVKLPPKEFTHDDIYAAPQKPAVPERTAEAARSLQPPPLAPKPARLPKRPTRLTSQELSTQGEHPELPLAKESAHANSTWTEEERKELAEFSLKAAPPIETKAVSEDSTMVLPGWQEELTRLRQEQAERKTAATEKPASTIIPEPEKPAPFIFSKPETTPERPPSKPLHELASPFTQERKPATSGSDQAGRWPEPRPAEQPQAKTWEQEPATQFPQPPAQKQVPGVGPAPAVAQTPFASFSFGSDERNEALAEMETVQWQQMNNPAPVWQAAQPSRDEHATQALAEEPGKIEDLPTAALTVPTFVQGKPSLKIERASTPPPGNSVSAQGTEVREEVEDQPTRPMPISFVESRAPQPPSVPDISSRLTDLPPLEKPVSRQAPGFEPARHGGRNLQPGNAFNPPSPPPQHGNLPSWGAWPSRGAEQASTTPTLAEPLPNTPRPNPAAVAQAVGKPRKRRRTGGIVVVLLLLLLVGGGVTWVVQTQPFTNQLAQNDQTYQNASLGFSLHYPLGWKASVDQANSAVHFADSSATGQVTVSRANANGSTLDQYLSQTTKQLAITGQKTGSPVSFAGETWQQVQGKTDQNGATYTITLYVTQHNGHFYALACLTLPGVYTQMEQDSFAPLRKTFQFL